MNTNGDAPFVIDGNTRVIGNPARVGEEQPEQADPDNAAEAGASGASDAHKSAALDAARAEADRIISEAREQADKIIEAAHASSDEIKENAYKAGFDKGLEEGAEEGRQRSDALIEQTMREQEELRNRIESDNEAYLKDASAKLTDFSCAMVEKLTGILVEDYKPVMFNMINNALNDTDTSLKYTIKVCEDSYYYLEDNKERIVGAANPNITIDIFSDPKLEKGQCTIETDNGIIDLSMDIQIQNFITVFKLLAQ